MDEETEQGNKDYIEREERMIVAIERIGAGIEAFVKEKAEQNKLLHTLNLHEAIKVELQKSQIEMQRVQAESVGTRLTNVQSGVTQILTALGMLSVEAATSAPSEGTEDTPA